MKTTRPRCLMAMMAALMMIGGCFPLKRPPVEKQLYSLEARLEGTTGFSKAPVAIMVKEFEIAPMYTTNAFVYRRGEFRFETDYYHEFIIPPQRMITEAIKQALFDTQRFTAAGPGTPAAYRLSGKVVRLHGDFSKPGQPLALMELSISLVPTGKEGRPVSKTFTRELALTDPAPATLVRAWNTLLEEIIREFMAGLPPTRPDGQ